MQGQKELIAELLSQLIPTLGPVSTAQYVPPAPQGATAQQILQQETIDAANVQADLEAKAQRLKENLEAGIQAEAQQVVQGVTAAFEQRRAQHVKEVSGAASASDPKPPEQGTQVATLQKQASAYLNLKREVAAARDSKIDGTPEEEEEASRVRTRVHAK